MSWSQCPEPFQTTCFQLSSAVHLLLTVPDGLGVPCGSSEHPRRVLRVSPPSTPFPCSWQFPPIHWLHCALFFGGTIWALLPWVSETWSHDFWSAVTVTPVWVAIYVTLKKKIRCIPSLFSDRQVVILPGPIGLKDLQTFMDIVLHIMGHTDSLSSWLFSHLMHNQLSRQCHNISRPIKQMNP